MVFSPVRGESWGRFGWGQLWGGVKLSVGSLIFMFRTWEELMPSPKKQRLVR